MDKLDQRPVVVSIAGRNYHLRTDEEADYVQDLADFVTARILGVKRDTGASPLDCATFAAFQLADELLKLRRRTADLP